MDKVKREVTVSGYTKLTEYYDEPFSMTYKGSNTVGEVVFLIKKMFPDIIIESANEKVY